MNIEDLSYDELVALNRRVVERLRRLDHMRTQTEMRALRMGERVRFQPRGRDPLEGTVAKFNKKTITVITDGGEHWNVAPSLVSKASRKSLAEPGAGKIIDIGEGREGSG